MKKTLTSVIRVDGSCFKHFLKLFNPDKDNTLSIKKNSCILDTDLAKKYNTDNKYKSCYPCELDTDKENYEYRNCSPVITNLKTDFNLDDNYERENIKICFSPKGTGKTFEYDFALKNASNELLLVESCANKSNLLLLQKIDPTDDEKFTIDAIIKNFTFNKEKESKNWLLKIDKKEECFACYYLNCVKNNKGEVAFDLGIKLRENLQYKNNDNPAEKAKYKEINIPKHIEDAIKWACSR